MSLDEEQFDNFRCARFSCHFMRICRFCEVSIVLRIGPMLKRGEDKRGGPDHPYVLQRIHTTVLQINIEKFYFLNVRHLQEERTL